MSHQESITHSSVSCPTRNPLVNNSSNTSQGASNSGSSQQQSSNGYVSSALALDTSQSQTARTMPVVVQQCISTDTRPNTISSITLQRKTTRDLISIYEQQTPPKVFPGHPLSSYPLQRGGRGKKLSLDAPLPTLPKVNPLRESFRNLLTVFNKAKRTFGDHPVVNENKRGGISSTKPQGTNSKDGPKLSGTPHSPVAGKPTSSRPHPGLSTVSSSLFLEKRFDTIIGYSSRGSSIL